ATTPATAHCDAIQVAQDRIDAWRSAFDDAGMTLTAEWHTSAAESGKSPHWCATQRADTAVSADVLAQILDVPLSNACRYAGPGTTTRLTVTTDPGWVTITVADDGTGVPDSELGQLTTRFFRGSTATGRTGSGLGLPIADALVTSRHGRLTVRAADPHGLAVVITLPAATVEQP
ncbi:sensor histidine kinase, partial [Nocardia sp. JMUB6875]|uniref:sensor histidine kinase n=1 Tax=Nocardia sp. JMUB6875 TaxID=3158170 RepID=UPI0034E86459